MQRSLTDIRFEENHMGVISVIKRTEKDTLWKNVLSLNHGSSFKKQKKMEEINKNKSIDRL